MQARELPQSQSQAFEIVLRIRHPSLDPAEISRELSVEAEHCFKAGEPRKPGSRDGSVHSETYWLATLDPGRWLAPEGFPEDASSTHTLNRLTASVLGLALSWCASRFLKPHAKFFRRIQSEGGEVRLLVEVNTALVDSFTLTSDLGRQMSALSLPIDFEFTAA